MVVDEFPIGYTLTKVLVAEERQFAGNELHLALVVLIFQERKVLLTPLADTDEIEIKFATESFGNQAPLGDLNTPVWCDLFIGKKLQTVWVCENAQGYRDQVIFAFDHLHPSIAFLSEGSALKAFLCKQIQKAEALAMESKQSKP